MDDLAGHVLRMLDFDDVGRSLVLKTELSFEMCGQTVYATPDYALVDDYVFLVHEDKANSNYISIVTYMP